MSRFVICTVVGLFTTCYCYTADAGHPHIDYVPHTTTHYHYVPHGNHYHAIPHTTTHYDPVLHYGSHYRNGYHSGFSLNLGHTSRYESPYHLIPHGNHYDLVPYRHYGRYNSRYHGH